MLDTLNQIELAANDLAELNYQLQLDREELAAIEAEISLQILDAKNDAGKPLYSNETARANALTLQLRQHTDYQFRLTNIRATEQEATPEVKARMASLMAEPSPTTPEQFSAFVRAELAKYEGVVKASGAKID